MIPIITAPMRPGMIPAMRSLPTELPVSIAYRTKALLGGIMIARVEAEATTPIAIPFLIPCFSISGMATLARTTQEAPPEPVAAPKAVAPTMVAWIMPPGIPSSQCLASLKPSSAKPARAAKVPIIRKRGMTVRVYCPIAEKGIVPAMPKALSPPTIIQNPMIVISPRQAKTGTPRKSSMTNNPQAINPTVTICRWALILMRIPARMKIPTRATINTLIERERKLRPDVLCHKGLLINCTTRRNPSKPIPRVIIR